MYKTRITICIAILMMTGLACGLYGTVSESGEGFSFSLTTTPIIIPRAILDDPRTYLVDTMTANLLSESFRVTIQEVSTKKTINYTAEFQPPDRYRLKVSGLGEMVMIGQQVYNVKGSWQKARVTAVFLYAYALLGPGGEDVSSSITDVKYVGLEQLNNKKVLVFTCTTHAQVGEYDTTGSNKLWLGANDGRLYKVVSVATSGDIHSTTTIKFEYGVNVKINPPD
jgi:hypothetical protein